MGILDKGKAWSVLFNISRRFLDFLFIIFMMLLAGCSTFTSSVFFVPQEQDLLFDDVERSDWVITNHGYGAIRPPLKSIDLNGNVNLTIYPILSNGHIEMFGPPLLPIIWIPEFLCLPPIEPLNVLHFIYTGKSNDLNVEYVDDILITKDRLKQEIHKGETHLYLSIPEKSAKKKTFNVRISVGGNVLHLKFNKSRSKNWFPLVVPL